MSNNLVVPPFPLHSPQPAETPVTYFDMHCQNSAPMHEPQRLTPEDEDRINRRKYLEMGIGARESTLAATLRITERMEFELKEMKLELKKMIDSFPKG